MGNFLLKFLYFPVSRSERLLQLLNYSWIDNVKYVQALTTYKYCYQASTSSVRTYV